MIEGGTAVDDLPHTHILGLALDVAEKDDESEREEESWCTAKDRNLAVLLDISCVDDVVDGHETRFCALKSTEV